MNEYIFFIINWPLVGYISYNLYYHYFIKPLETIIGKLPKEDEIFLKIIYTIGGFITGIFVILKILIEQQQKND